MADFAEWASSCEPSMLEAGTFMRAYHENIESSVAEMIEANPVAVAVRNFMEDRTAQEGTAETLLTSLSFLVGEVKSKRKDWPQSARALSGKLTRSAANLRKIGIEIIHGVRTKKARPLSLLKRPIQPSPSSPRHQTAENREKLGDGSGDGMTVGGDDVVRGDDMPKETVTAKPLENNENDGDDGGDGQIPTPEVCRACDGNYGRGCPTCRPEAYGLPPRVKTEGQPDMPPFLRREK